MNLYSMNKKLKQRYSRIYGIELELVEKVYTIARKYDIHIYDALTLINRHSYAIEANVNKYTYVEKLSNWYRGKRLLVNTSAYIQAATNYSKTGKYTNAIKNNHPSSEYMKFWTEEARRCIYGYHIGTDWIPGYFYFYLNYSPIELVVVTDDSAKGNKVRAERQTALPAFWDGDYYYFHYLEECERTGMSASVLKARGRGYSWKGASMLDRNFYLIPKSKSIVYASSKEYLSGNDGILTKAWSIMHHIDTNTAWSKRRQVKNTDTHKRASLQKTVNNVKVEYGFMSEISGVTLGDNVHKLRGKRSKLILFEEAGSFKNLITAWIVSKPSIEQDGAVFGLRIPFGTGGEEGNVFTGLKELFYKPLVHGICGIPNLWSKNSTHIRVGWFVPTYINMYGYYDKDGNSDIIKAKAFVEQQRQEAIEAKMTPSDYQKMKAENPIIPEDAVLRAIASPFPVELLTDHLGKLETDTAYRGTTSVGQLLETPAGDIYWKEDLKNTISIIGTDDINEYNRVGGIEIFNHPPNKKPPNYAYIIGVDPIDFDMNEVGKKYSLGSTFVLNTFTEQIVAEYTGRPDSADTYYENVRRLGIYYNAKIMYENNIKGMFTYFKNKYCEHMLASKPTILQDSVTNMSMGNRKFGFTATSNQHSSILKYGRQEIKKWLEKYIDDENSIRILHSIKSTGLLKELIEWHYDGNFDRVSALIALMIYLQDTTRLRKSIKDSVIDIKKQSFWTKPFAQ